MAYSEAQKKASMKYVKNNYDRIEIKVPKGKKAIYQEYATLKGERLNKLIPRMIDEAIAVKSKGDE